MLENQTTYTFYIYYKDTRLSKFKTYNDDLEGLYKEYGEGLIRDGFKHGMNIPYQIKWFDKFIDSIYKQKIDCYKIKSSEHLQVLSCFLGLIKYGQIDCTDYMFIKNK